MTVLPIPREFYMKQPTNLLECIVISIGWLVVAVVTALFLNFTGDCNPETVHCGETARCISFGVLLGGLAAAIFTVVQYQRNKRARK